jgi:hypothetical protein
MIYKVTDSSEFEMSKLGIISGSTYVDGCHLMYDASEEEVKRNYLFNTLLALNVQVDKIPVMLTGNPAKYSSKRGFLIDHPEYVETTSWKQVKVLFTDSFASETSKMKKARNKGIEIKLY